MSFKYICKYYYIGSKKYYGSQRQGELPTIEGVIINALIEKGYIQDEKSSKCEFASRTDKKVSARGAAFSFLTEKPIHLMEINSALPQEIGLWSYAEIQEGFHPRFAAYYRHYKYIVSDSIKIKNSLDLQAMQKGCSALLGDHDFSNFSKTDTEDVKTLRTIDSVELNIINDYLVLDFVSRAFLRQQIRRMVKKLLELGMGEISFEEFMELFNPSKTIAYGAAAPEGLVLWDIDYGDEIDFIIDEKSWERMTAFFRMQEQTHALKTQLFRTLSQQNDLGK